MHFAPVWYISVAAQLGIDGGHVTAIAEQQLDG